MADPHDYTAAINRKGCDNTGITEDLAREMYATLGRRTLAIVELKHHARTETDDNGRSVQLQITQIEPSVDERLDDHLRELMRTMHQNRALKADDQQLQIDTLDDTEPTVTQVIAAGQQHIAQTDDALDLEDDDHEAESEAARQQIEQEGTDAVYADEEQPPDDDDHQDEPAAPMTPPDGYEGPEPGQQQRHLAAVDPFAAP